MVTLYDARSGSGAAAQGSARARTGEPEWGWACGRYGRDEASTSEASTTPRQFQQLADILEEESLEDGDYYLNLATLDLLRERQADQALVRTIENALAGRDELDIRWERA